MPEGVTEAKQSSGIKSKIMHEITELLLLSGFFGLFFFAFATYKMFLLKQFHSAQFIYVTALINTLVVAKVVLIGDFIPLGRAMEHKALIVSAVYKAGFFAVFVALFHFVEELVRALIHDHRFVEAFQETFKATWVQLIGLLVISFCLFIPFFALWEIRRIMGEKQFSDLFLTAKNPRVTLSK